MAAGEQVSSPVATGGGGEQFEQHVDAYALALLLVGSTAPVLLDCSVTEVHLQTRHFGWRTDDLLIIGDAGPGVRRKLAIQAKRSFTVSAADADCVGTIQAMWDDFMSTSRFDRDRDRLAIATLRGTTTLLSAFASLLDAARAAFSADDFRRRVQLRGFLSEKARTQNDALRTIIEAHISASLDDGLYWEFLRAITVLSLDLGTDTAHTQAHVLALLAHSVSGSGDPGTLARATWRHLLEVASSGRRGAASYRRDSLPAELRERHATIPSRDDRAVRDLIGHGRTVRDSIRTTIAEGHVIDRSEHTNALREQLEVHSTVVVTGGAGAGKSALARTFLETVERERPVFAFQAVEFGTAHINDTLGRTQAAVNADAFISLLAAHDRVVVFVDGVERLLESSVRDAFTHLLHLAGRTSSMRLVLTCRDYSVETVRSELLSPAGVAHGVLEVGPLSDDELDSVAGAVPRLGPPLMDPHLRTFLRTPYLLDMAARLNWARETMPRDLRTFRDLCWRQLVRNDAHPSRGMPQKRESAFLAVARRRAEQLRPFVTAASADPEALDELVQASLLERAPELRALYAPAHDVLEDWAIVRWLADVAAAADDAAAVLAQTTGGLPAVRRGFRRWLAEGLDLEPEATAAFVLSASKREDLPQHFRDDCIVAVLASHTAPAFIDALREQVVGGDLALLRQQVHLLRVACKTAPAWLPAAGLPSTLLVPSGPGWVPTLELVASVLPEMIDGDALLALGLVEDWANQVSIEMSAQDGADAAGRIASGLLERFDGYGFDDARKRVLQVILKIPSHAPAFQQLVDRADTSRQDDRIAREFAEMATSTLSCAFASRDFPDEVARLLRARIFMSLSGPRHRYGSPTGVDECFGLLGDRGIQSFFPASALQGPFWALLRHHPRSALDFIIEVLNHAGEWYGERRWPGNDLELAERATIEVPGVGPVTQWVNGRLFLLYRGMTVGPDVLKSALMALERWLFDMAAFDEFDLEAWLVYILRHSNNAMATGVVASLCTAFPVRAGKAGIAMLSSRELIELDRQRLSNESTSLLEFMMGLEPAQRIYEEERRQSNARPHRREDLEGMAISLQLTDRREAVWAIIDRHRSSLPTDSDDETVTWRLALHRMDLRGYAPVEPQQAVGRDEPKDGRVYYGPGRMEPDVERLVTAGREQMAEIGRHLRVKNAAQAAWEARGTDGQAEEWRALLADARALVAEGDPPQPYLDGGPGIVAALCIRDHLIDLQPNELEWCANRVAAELAISHGADESRVYGRMFGPDRAAAAVVPLLVAEAPHVVGDDPDALLILALTHPVREVSDYAYAGAGAFLGPEHVLGLRCGAAAVRHAAVTEAERVASWERGRTGYVEQFVTSDRAREAVRDALDSSADDARAIIESVGLESWEGRRAARHVASLFEGRPQFVESRAFYKKVAEWLANRWLRRRESRNDRDFDFEFDMSRRIAGFALRLPPTEACEVCTPLEEVVDTEPNEVERFVHDLIAGTDGGSDDSFWPIWQRFADRAVSAPWVSRLDRDRPYEASFIHRIFLTTYWKDDVTHWARLDGEAWRVHALAQRLPGAPIVLDAYARFLYTIGQQSLPDAFKTVSAMLPQGDATRAISGSETAFLLESLLGRFVRSEPHRLKTDAQLRDAVLSLLDVLVSTGSSAAYRMRDDFVTPVRVPGQ
jgi:hypothetical protein